MKKVNLYWIRHAFSCANLLEHKGTIANIARPIVTIDPVLTRAGVNQSKALNNEFITNKIHNKFDIVLCSNLKRAMETALYAFDNINTIIYVVPYISEERNPYAFNLDNENAPQTANELEQYYQSIQHEFNVKVNFDILKNLDPTGQLKPSYDNFMKIILTKILNINIMAKNIAIVSHSHFIEKHLINDLKMPDTTKMQNTQIWKETLTLKLISHIDSYNYDNNNKVYDGKPIPTQYEIDNDDRCCNAQQSSLYTIAINNSASCDNVIISPSINIQNQLSVKIITWNMGSSITKITDWKTEIKRWQINNEHDIIFIGFQETTKNIGDDFKHILSQELNDYTIFSEGEGSLLAPTFYVYGYLCVKKVPTIIINKLPIENNVFDDSIDSTCIRKMGICTKPSLQFTIIVNNIKLIFICSHLPIITKNDPSFGFQERKDAMKTIINNVMKSNNNADMIFWCGDMNFRVNQDKTEQLQYLLNNLPNELPELDGFKEHKINFKHTCRLLEYDDIQNYNDFIKNRPYDKKREPSYCDRVIFKGNKFEPSKYYNLPSVLTEYPLSIAYSDHEPVVLEGIVKNNVEQTGGAIEGKDYYEKYMKYKNKYLELKKK